MSSRKACLRTHPNCIIVFCICFTSVAAPILAIAAPAVPREVPTVLVVAAVCSSRMHGRTIAGLD